MSIESQSNEPNIASYESFLELVKARRAVRFIDGDRDVPPELIDKVIEAARWAPSAGNGQPWEFVVIRDAQMREKIVDLYKKQMAEKKEMQLAVWGRGSRNTHVGYSAFKDAPVFLLMICDTRTKRAFPVRTQLDKGDRHLISGMGLSSAMLHLAIASLGLSSQWISDVGSPYLATMLRSLLDIPDYFDVYDMTGVGYPARGLPDATSRRPLEEILHHEKYEASKTRDEAALDEFLAQHTRLGWGEQHKKII